jgi:hypothetical protein
MEKSKRSQLYDKGRSIEEIEAELNEVRRTAVEINSKESQLENELMYAKLRETMDLAHKYIYNTKEEWVMFVFEQSEYRGTITIQGQQFAWVHKQTPYYQNFSGGKKDEVLELTSKWKRMEFSVEAFKNAFNGKAPYLKELTEEEYKEKAQSWIDHMHQMALCTWHWIDTSYTIYN